MNELTGNRVNTINDFMQNRKLAMEMAWAFGSSLERGTVEVSNGVAIIPICGVLVESKEFFADFEQTSYEEIDKNISSVMENPQIHTIILDFNSPGGDVNGLFETCDFILECKKNKCFLAMVNGGAFSAAYALASCCDSILVSETGGVGSVGVICQHVDYSKAEEKSGIKVTSIFAGKHKNDLSPHEPLSDDAEKDLQEEVNRLYEKFVQLVAKNRGLTIEAVKNTEAKTFFGENAKKIGFIDNLVNRKAVIKRLRGDSIMAKVENVVENSACKDNAQAEIDNTKLEQYRGQILEISKLCEIAKSNRLAEFIKNGASVEEVKSALLEDSQKSTEINNSPAHGAVENPLIAMARKIRDGGK